MKATISEEYLVTLGERIVQLRKEKGLTQKELALQCDWEDSNLRKIERGRTNPTIKSLLKICSCLNITMKELFDFEIQKK